MVDEILQGEKPKRRRMRKNSKSNSKVLKYIWYSLKNGLHKEVLSWKNKEERKFKVKFLHKNNPTWNETILSLFKATEEFISNERFKNYSMSSKHSEKCKTRYRANLKKLCEAGALICQGQKKLPDKSIEKVYKITNYSDDATPLTSSGKDEASASSSGEEQFMCDLSNDYEVNEIIENICEMNVNKRETKVEVESQVSIIVPVEIPSKEISHYLCLSNQVSPLRSADTSSNNYAFPQENVLDMLRERNSSEGCPGDLACQSKEQPMDIENCTFVEDPDPIQMQVGCEPTREPTLNMLNCPTYPSPDNVHTENIFVRTVSVPNSDFNAIPQTNIVQNRSAHNSAVMQSSLLRYDMEFPDFQVNDLCECNEMDNANLHSPGEANFTKLQNVVPDSYNDSSLSMSENENSYNLRCDDKWNIDLHSTVGNNEKVLKLFGSQEDCRLW